MRKVVLVGVGAVGCAYAYGIINQGLATELVLVDVDEYKAEGEAMDLLHSTVYAPSNIHVRLGSYADCADAALVVITAGANQKPGETRLQLVNQNIAIMQSIVKEVVHSGFDGIFLIASNPVDILTHVVQRESGFPAHRVIGSGTTLDTARLKVALGQYFDIDPRDVHAFIIGEHGDSELAAWSQTMIGAERLEKMLHRRNNPADNENLEQIFIQVRDAAYEIIKRKGVTNYGIGMCLTKITQAIFHNEHRLLTVSCLLTGEYGEEDIYLSVPAIIHREGVKKITEIELNELEQKQFTQSVAAIRNIYRPSSGS